MVREVMEMVWEVVKPKLFRAKAYLALAHRCTIFLCHLDLEIDDKYKNPNANTKIISWADN